MEPNPLLRSKKRRVDRNGESVPAAVIVKFLNVFCAVSLVGQISEVKEHRPTGRNRWPCPRFTRCVDCRSETTAAGYADGSVYCFASTRSLPFLGAESLLASLIWSRKYPTAASS